MSVASIITLGRIAGSLSLLLTAPFSVAFFVVYTFCCASDVLDGFIARKTSTTSKSGETLDSFADIVFISVVIIIVVPTTHLKLWTIIWICAIAVARLLSLAIGYVKYHAFPSLHTYANKAAGIALALFPVIYQALGLTITAFALCGIASLSALEELVITIREKTLNRNIIGIYHSGGALLK